MNLYIICNEHSVVVGVSSVNQKGAIDISGLDALIPRGSIYDGERNIIITPDGQIVSFVKKEDNRIEEV